MELKIHKEKGTTLIAAVPCHKNMGEEPEEC